VNTSSLVYWSGGAAHQLREVAREDELPQRLAGPPDDEVAPTPFREQALVHQPCTRQRPEPS